MRNAAGGGDGAFIGAFEKFRQKQVPVQLCNPPSRKRGNAGKKQTDIFDFGIDAYGSLSALITSATLNLRS
jgi:hypothetical protein